MPDLAPPDRRGSSDRGSTSLQVVLLTPILAMLMFAGWQAALWNHARTETRTIARETAVLVSRDGLGTGEAVAAAQASLASSELHSPAVEIVRTADTVTVTITGSAPGILRGTWSKLSVTAAVPLRGWVPL